LKIAGRTVAMIWTHPENRGRRGRALGKYFAWQLWERTVRRPWSVRLIADIRIRCHPHSPIASAVLYYGLADHREMRFLLSYLRPGQTLVDVGANVGIYSLLACSIPGVTTVTLEPSTAAFERLTENVRLNHLQDRVTLIKAAAGRTEGAASLTIGRDAMNSLVEDTDLAVEEVQVTTLDAIAGQVAEVALVKIDVEGWETEVLEGATRCLTHQRPVLIVEVNDDEGIEAIRRRYGYQCVRYDPESNLLELSEVSAANGRNALLIPDMSSVQSRLDGTDPGRVNE
jgi:FkbM family methyltransferase